LINVFLFSRRNFSNCCFSLIIYSTSALEIFLIERYFSDITFSSSFSPSNNFDVKLRLAIFRCSSKIFLFSKRYFSSKFFSLFMKSISSIVILFIELHFSFVTDCNSSRFLVKLLEISLIGPDHFDY